MKKIIIAILIAAELSSWATREYMVQTAQPDNLDSKSLFYIVITRFSKILNVLINLIA